MLGKLLKMKFDSGFFAIRQIGAGFEKWHRWVAVVVVTVSGAMHYYRQDYRIDRTIFSGQVCPTSLNRTLSAAASTNCLQRPNQSDRRGEDAQRPVLFLQSRRIGAGRVL